MLKVIFEDNQLLILDKPPGLVVTKSETDKALTLEDILVSEYGIKVLRGGVVHRLDKDTSGLLVVAKTDQALANLQAQFKNREVKKEYLALVHGWVEKGGKVDAPIIRNPGDREKFIVFTNPVPDGTGQSREAVTEYEPVKNYQFSILNFQSIFNDLNKIQTKKLERMNYNQFTLLKCHPQTGRTHQIRVHLKYIGFSIVGDGKYGGRKIVRLDHRWCLRQFLHAAKLEINHPEMGKRMVFESPLPEDLQKVIGLLEEVGNKK